MTLTIRMALAGAVLCLMAFSLTACNEEESVHGAAFKGDKDAVIEYLDQGGDINARHSASGGSLIAYAVKAMDDQFISNLINMGADPNQKDNNGISALHYAAKYHRPNVVVALMSGGADPDTFSMEYHLRGSERGLENFPFLGLPLHWAIYEEHGESTVHALLREGADPNAKSGFRQTPLEMAILTGNHNNVDQLLDARADPNAGVALHFAAAFNNKKLVETLLLAGADPKRLAVSNEQKRIFVKFLEDFASPDKENLGPFLPIDLTTNEEVRALLLEAMR